MPKTDIKKLNSQPKTAKKPFFQRPFLQFLGSMNLAITLLMMLAIASVIGTILQQNQVFQDYILKFGPFWTQVFNSLGLFHVYGAAWFVLVLIFLLISTAVCVGRNSPGFLRDMRQFSEKMSINAYKHQPYSETYSADFFDEEKAKLILKENGFKTKTHQRENGVTVAGMKGRYNKIGYILTHVSIIVICIGALFDSNFLLKYRELTGNLVAETRSVTLAEIPKKSWVAEDNFSFRGSVSVAEGQETDILFLSYGKGFLVQQLPFNIKVKDFRIEYYDTGMPKSYESDLVLTFPDSDKVITETISVNKPLYYKNFAIYQSSFGDGGSKLSLKVHPLMAPESNPLELNTRVGAIKPLKTPRGTYKAEFNDFRLFNIVPNSAENMAKTGRKMHNNGPSIVFKVRNDQGKAWEYENFMMPNKQDGRLFFMTGMRTSQAKPFLYLFIPADENRSKERFFEFLALINNSKKSTDILKEAIPKTLGMDAETYNLQIRLLNQLLVLFRQKGFEGINLFIENNVPKHEREKVKEYYFDQVSLALQIIYLELVEPIEPETKKLSEFDKQWFEDAIVVINSLSKYGPPLYFELTSFEHIEATGLQITKSPGKNTVFFGSTLLIIGIFILFYLRQKRIWIAYSSTDNTITVAGKDSRDLPENKHEFAKLANIIKNDLKGRE